MTEAAPAATTPISWSAEKSWHTRASTAPMLGRPGVALMPCRPTSPPRSALACASSPQPYTSPASLLFRLPASAALRTLRALHPSERPQLGVTALYAPHMMNKHAPASTAASSSCDMMSAHRKRALCLLRHRLEAWKSMLQKVAGHLMM